MLKYGKNRHFDPDSLHPLNIDRQSIRVIPNGSKVLEIGCATGFAGEYLQKKKNCVVDGIELGQAEAAIARKRLNSVMIGDIENESTLKMIVKKYDVVYASALIEHLKDPWEALVQWRKFLQKDGMLVLTTSNIAHWSMRMQLLRGNFIYRQYGILDNTHLRFFSYKTFKILVEDSGYSVSSYAIDAVGGGYPKVSNILSHVYPNLFAYQLLIVAKLK